MAIDFGPMPFLRSYRPYDGIGCKLVWDKKDTSQENYKKNPGKQENYKYIFFSLRIDSCWSLFCMASIDLREDLLVWAPNKPPVSNKRSIFFLTSLWENWSWKNHSLDDLNLDYQKHTWKVVLVELLSPLFALAFNSTYLISASTYFSKFSQKPESTQP